MEDQITISWATEDEVRATKRMTDACAVGYAKTGLWDFKSSIPRVEPDAWASYSHVLVAKKGDKRVGFMLAEFPLSLGKDGEWSTIAWLRFVYPMRPAPDMPVSPAEDQEIQRAMVEFFLSETAKRDFGQVAVIGVSSEDAALVSILEEQGFTIAERRYTMLRPGKR